MGNMLSFCIKKNEEAGASDWRRGLHDFCQSFVRKRGIGKRVLVVGRDGSSNRKRVREGKRMPKVKVVRRGREMRGES